MPTTQSNECQPTAGDPTQPKQGVERSRGLHLLVCDEINIIQQLCLPRSTTPSLRIRHVVRCKSVQNANYHFDQQLKQHQIAQFSRFITVKIVGKIHLAGKINFKPNLQPVQQAHLVFINWEREGGALVPFSHKLLFQWEATETGIAAANVAPQHPESHFRSQSHCTSSNNKNNNNNKGELCSSFCFSSLSHLLPFSACVFCISPFSVSRLSCCQKILWRLLLFLCAARDTKMIIKKYKWERVLSGGTVLNEQILCNAMNWNDIKTSRENSQI